MNGDQRPSKGEFVASDDARPGFTVVVPLYNKGPYIARTLASVLSQRYPAEDVIVVDDGSTDHGADLVASEFPTVTLIRQANAGVGAARNTGLKAARSDWIAFLDADDAWSPTHLAELARIAERFPAADLLSTRWMRVREGEPWPAWPAGSTPELRRIDYFREAALQGGPVWTSAAAVSRRAYERFGGFGSAPLGEDQEYWARIALGGQVAVSALVTAAYVRGVASVTEQARQEEASEMVPTRARHALPVFATLEDALSAGEHTADPGSIHLYWNTKLERKAREALSRSQYERARALVSFMIAPLHRWQRALAFVTRLPDWLLHGIMGLRARLSRQPRAQRLG